jgi:hypothetical protein
LLIGGKETNTCLDKYFGQTIETTGVRGMNKWNLQWLVWNTIRHCSSVNTVWPLQHAIKQDFLKNLLTVRLPAYYAVKIRYGTGISHILYTHQSTAFIPGYLFCNKSADGKNCVLSNRNFSSTPGCQKNFMSCNIKLSCCKTTNFYVNSLNIKVSYFILTL